MVVTQTYVVQLCQRMSQAFVGKRTSDLYTQRFSWASPELVAPVRFKSI